MPRIIDVDTEAFAPTYQKAYREREPIGDVQTRRMMADLQLAGQAMPFVSEGIKGIDQYVVTPIQQALKAGREEEYKGKKAGEGLLEPGETAMQKIARERLERTAEAQKPSYIGGEEAAKMFGEERPEFGELELELGKIEPGELGNIALMDKQREEQLAAQRLKEQAQARLASLPEEAARRAAAESRYMPSLMPIRPTTEADRQRFAANVAEALKARPQAAAPTEPTPTRMMPEHPVPTGYQWPARGRYTAAGKPEEGFAGAEAPTEPTQTAQMAKMAATTARGGAPAAAEPAAPTGPKTLATATDDELDTAKRKLENLVKQNPGDKELADRLELVNLEQRHRGEKMEYEDWAAQARAADTLEEQRRVLEMAKRVRMPVEGLEGLLRSPFERAKLKALGSREEKGLFPEVARPLNEWEIQKKEVDIRIAQLKAQGVPEKQASEQALAEKRRADAGLARARTETEETLREPRYAAAAEKPFLMHSQEELNNAKTQEVLALMPKKVAKYDADIARLRALAAAKKSGHGVSSKDLEWAKLWLNSWDKEVDNAANVAMAAKKEAGALERQAEAAQMEAEGKAADYAEYEKTLAKIPTWDPNYGKVQAELFEKRAAANAQARAAKVAKANAEAAKTASTEAQTKLEQAQKAGDEGKNRVRYLYGRSVPGQGDVGRTPPAPTPAAAPTAASTQTSQLQTTKPLPDGVTLTGEIKIVKGQKYAVGSDGKGYKIKE